MFFDEKLGKPITDKPYNGHCLPYDSDVPEDVYYKICNCCNCKIDIFTFSHVFGFFLTTLVFRDWWICTVLSVMFEFLEYSLEHQLITFYECWLDHWIIDVLICNAGGTVLGLLTLRYLSMKTYNWRDLYNIPTYRGKIKQIQIEIRCLMRIYQFR